MKAEGRRKKEEGADLRTRTKEFALRIIRLYLGLPKRTEAQVIGRQIISECEAQPNFFLLPSSFFPWPASVLTESQFGRPPSLFPLCRVPVRPHPGRG